MRDHGGDLDRAKARFGGDGWIDLSTGINPVVYPMPDLSRESLAALPTRSDIEALEAAARAAYRTSADCVALAGAQAAIQLVPRLGPARDARVLGPTYNEHAAALAAQGWAVGHVSGLEALEGANLAVVVNPNNPDGRSWKPEDLMALSERVGLLVVDESFADPMPEISVAPLLGRERQGAQIVVLRSFGKFYGLAGLRLGFALGTEPLMTAFRRLSGPWAVSGPAIAAGRAALADETWQEATAGRLAVDAARLDALAERAGWLLVGGTPLFRTYRTEDAAAAQDRLAKARIWTRVFPYSDSWIRLGLPGTDEAWARLQAALAGGGE